MTEVKLEDLNEKKIMARAKLIKTKKDIIMIVIMACVIALLLYIVWNMHLITTNPCDMCRRMADMTCIPTPRY
jgi:hypothetical protein